MEHLDRIIAWANLFALHFSVSSSPHHPLVLADFHFHVGLRNSACNQGHINHASARDSNLSDLDLASQFFVGCRHSVHLKHG